MSLKNTARKTSRGDGKHPLCGLGLTLGFLDPCSTGGEHVTSPILQI